ncbi:hypothetical protein Tco_0815510 [Tanacetum coccineum]
MPYLGFTKIIINYFLSVYKSVPKGLPSGLYTIKDDGVLSRMKFVRIREDVQEYEKAIPYTLLNDAIKQSEAYKAFIGYSTCLLPPKKTKGKGSKGKQQEVTIKKKTVITIDDNIITDDLDVAFELGKSISKTDAKIANETSRVHDTHACLVTEKDASEKEPDPEPANRPTERRRPSVITFRDTPNVPKKKSECLEVLANAGGSSKGTGITPGVSDESSVILTTSSEGTCSVYRGSRWRQREWGDVNCVMRVAETVKIVPKSSKEVKG